ncbi:MAG: DUF1592 domain-containing protein [Myxococcales bacterium]|nr:MAG: DUF1592 domain-containing protein [Myxococcales bacterium]
MKRFRVEAGRLGRVWRLSKDALLLSGAVSAAACTGALDSPTGMNPSAGGASAQGGSTGIGGSAAGAGAVAGGGSGPVDTGLPGRSLIRRLSNVEYDATIKALLGDATSYASAFPTDSVVNGFTNNTDVQDVAPALAEQLLIAAEKVAAKAAQNPDALLGCKLADGDACIQTFIERFGKRAWRRPLDAVEREDLLGVFRAGSTSHGAVVGFKLLLEALLVSPSFLYRVEVGTPMGSEPYTALTSWEVATRLSYFLTGTMPDEALFTAAAADGLRTPEGIAAEAKRLLATPAAREQVASFFSGWLNLRAVERLERDKAQFPQWSSTLPPLLMAETRAFTTQVVFEGAGDLKTLLTAPYTYGDPTLAALYGGTAGPAQNGIARIDLPPAQRAGLLTQVSFLATHAKEIQTDPVARGKFVRERILCQGIPAPPPELMISAPEITPGTTTRQRFVEHEANPVCATCHTLIDPVGLAFENYDAAGAWRVEEQGRPIDASGDLTSTDVSAPLNGVVEMATKLAQSEMVSECFVRNWFRFAFGRGEGDEEAARIGTLATEFRSADDKVLELMVTLTKSPDFRYLAKQVP